MNKIRIISASAGTGKTGELMQILYDEIQSGRVEPQGLMAVSFTTKAAGELARRVRQKLLEAGRPELAQAVATARIGTVHSVCSRLLSQFAYEEGMSPHQRAVDEVEAKELFARANGEVFTEEKKTKIGSLAIKFELSIGDLMGVVKEISDRARQNGISAENLDASLQASLEQIHPLFPKETVKDLSKKLQAEIQKYVKAHATPPDAIGLTAKAHEIVHEAHRHFEEGLVLWKEWLALAKLKPGQASASLFAPIQALANEFPKNGELHHEIAELMTQVYTLAREALDIFRQKKAALGVIDYQDMELRALELLGRPEVQARLRDELQLLMVDEFQDTNPIQLAIFLKLSELCPQTVWVGDAKQSIFSIQGADMALMNSVVQTLADGKPEILKENRRSRAELNEFSSTLFEKAFSRDGFDPKQVRVETHSSVKLTCELPALSFWKLDGSNIATRIEAMVSEVAALLKKKPKVFDRQTRKSRPLEPGDIAVLVPTNDGCSDISSALKRYGIDSSYANGSLLSEPEIQLALAAYRYVINRTDRLAAAELAILTGEDHKAWLKKAVTEVEPKDWSPVIPKLEALRDHCLECSPSELLDLVIATAGIDAYVEKLERGFERLSRLGSLRALAAKYENHCLSTLAPCSATGFLTHLSELESAERDSVNAWSRPSAVDVMTYHKSKGLEWPVVILYGSETDARSASLFSVQVTGPEGKDFDVHAPLKDRRVLYLPWPFGGMTAPVLDGRMAELPSWQKLNERGRAEQRRLLYVGMTRAREAMIITAGGTAKKPPFQPDSKMATLCNSKDEPLLNFPSGTEVSVAGRKFPCDLKVCEVRESYALKPSDQQLVLPNAAPAAKTWPLLQISPSSLSLEAPDLADVQIGRVVGLGGKLVPIGQADPATLGDAVHLFLASDDPARSGPERLALATEIVDRWKLNQALKPADLVAASDRFQKAIATLWPKAKLFPEYPLLASTGGSLLKGSIDLWVADTTVNAVVDHKTTLIDQSALLVRAREHAPQLAAYSHAVAAASLGKPIQLWLHYPLGGFLGEVILTDASQIVTRAIVNSGRIFMRVSAE